MSVRNRKTHLPANHKCQKQCKKKSFNSAEVAEKAETGSNRMRMKELCGTSSAWEPKVERKKKLQFLFFLYVKL